MNLAATDNDHADSPPPGHADAFAALIGLARMSRLNLLYYRSGQADAGSRLLLEAARQRGGNEIAMLFDEWEGAPLAMLQQRLDEAVNAADPGAAPHFGDVHGALAHWQHEQGLRFFLILHAFERHLQRDAEAADVTEFDRALIRLTSDPMLDLHILLCIDEGAAPALERLRPFLADLGQEYLRMPEVPGAAPQPSETTQRDNGLQPTAPEPKAPADEPVLPILPIPPLSHGAAPVESMEGFIDTGPTDTAPGEAEDSPGAPRRRRDFTALLETLNAAPLAAMPPTPIEAPPGAAYGAPPPASAETTPLSSDAFPTRVYPWFTDHIRHRRLRTLRLFAGGMLTATAMCFTLLVVMALLWELPQLGPSTGAAHPAMLKQAPTATAPNSSGDIMSAAALASAGPRDGGSDLR